MAHRYLHGELWPSCARCERQFPDDYHDTRQMQRLGWVWDAAHATWICPPCAVVLSRTEDA